MCNNKDLLYVLFSLYTADIPSLSSLNLLKWKSQEGQEQEFRLVNRVSAEWQGFGLLLGLGMNQLRVWRQERLGDVTMCWNLVMEHWLKGDSADYPPSWEGLYTLLQDMEFSTQAREMKEAVEQSLIAPH